MKVSKATGIFLIVLGVLAYLPVLNTIYGAIAKLIPLLLIALGIWILIKN